MIDLKKDFLNDKKILIPVTLKTEKRGTELTFLYKNIPEMGACLISFDTKSLKY